MFYKPIGCGKMQCALGECAIICYGNTQDLLSLLGAGSAEKIDSPGRMCSRMWILYFDESQLLL